MSRRKADLDLPPGLAEAFERLLMGEPKSLDEMNHVLAREAEAYNRRPQAELGGLSPVEVERLLTSDWMSDQSALRLSRDLSPYEVERGIWFIAARHLLDILVETGGVQLASKSGMQLTDAGYVTLISALENRLGPVEPLERPDGEADDDAEGAAGAAGFSHAFYDVICGEALVLLEMARLVRRYKGRMLVSRDGEALRDETRAPELFTRLVRAFFVELDVPALLGAPEVFGALQHTAAFTLYQLSLSDGRWRTASQLFKVAVLPDVREQLVALMPQVPQAMRGTPLQVVVLSPLTNFGLLESRADPKDPERSQFRPTALLRRTFEFSLGAGAAPPDGVQLRLIQ